MHDNDEIKFVADRYSKGRFDASKGWQRLGIARSARWRRLRIAAAVGGVIFLSASAAFFYNHLMEEKSKPVVVQQTKTTAPIASPVNTPNAKAVKVIDFENTPLREVIESIRSIYGVEVENIPANADEYTISLHYEGNASDLIQTINEILDTQMTVKE